MNSNCNLLLSLNTYAFAGAAQAVLSSLSHQELQNLLDVLQHLQQYRRLAKLIRSKIFVCLAEQVDRTDYYLHYDSCNLTLMQEERTRNISQVCKEAYL